MVCGERWGEAWHVATSSEPSAWLLGPGAGRQARLPAHAAPHLADSLLEPVVLCRLSVFDFLTIDARRCSADESSESRRSSSSSIIASTVSTRLPNSSTSTVGWSLASAAAKSTREIRVEADIGSSFEPGSSSLREVLASAVAFDCASR